PLREHRRTSLVPLPATARTIREDPPLFKRPGAGVEQVERRFLPSTLLPKTLLMFARAARKRNGPSIASSSERKTKRPPADGLLPALLSGSRSRAAPVQQKMYSRVAFGSPLLTSREYSDNLTRPKNEVQGRRNVSRRFFSRSGR